MSMYNLFNRKMLRLKPLRERRHDLSVSIINQLSTKKIKKIHKNLAVVAKRIIYAKKNRASVILMIGGHVIRAGVQRYIIDLMEKGYISCIAMNGSGMIHDFEFALIGATTENVTRYIKEGQFGLWKEAGRINDYINQGYKAGLGMGESIGKVIFERNYPYKDISLLANGYMLKIPMTVHVGIGYDIIHEHPNCNGAATGATSYRDFLYFVKVVENLRDGVIMNFGSAIMAPEVFLKALSMARNVAHQQGRYIKRFTSLVCDLYKLPRNYSKEPDKGDPIYYFRPLKTMLIRAIKDGGEGYYVRGDHVYTIPALWTAIMEGERKDENIGI